MGKEVVKMKPTEKRLLQFWQKASEKEKIFAIKLLKKFISQRSTANQGNPDALPRSDPSKVP